MSGLILVQTVCKDYQQTTQFAAGGQTVNGYDYQIDKEKLFTLILNSESVRVTLDELTEGKDYFWRSM